MCRYKQRLFSLLLFGFLGLSSLAFAANSLEAKTDRTAVAVGETFQLMLTLNGKETGSSPDFQSLEKNFSIVGVAQEQQANIFNGQSSESTQWTLTLSPKEKGTLTIPAFAIGQLSSQPLTIEVAAASDSAGELNVENRDVFFTTTLLPEDPYVQSQAIYTVALYSSKTIDNVQFVEPHGENLTLFHLGQDRQFTKTIQGKVYQILERHYAVVPQKSGELTLEGGALVGSLWKEQTHSAFYIARPEPITKTVDPLTINVKPIPAEAQKAQWLPAQELTIRQSWSPSSPKWEVGQPVTRTITIEAIGLMAEQLPDLAMHDIPNVQIYSEKPVLQTSTDGKMLLGKRIEKFILIPTNAGALKLPPIDISWWSLKKQTNQAASVPGYEQTIIVGNNAQKNLPSENIGTTTPPESIDKLTTSEPFWKTGGIWIWVALAVTAGWIMTLCFIGFRQRTTKKITKEILQLKDITQRNARDKLKQACAQNNLQQAKIALVEWANALWPKLVFRSLGDIEKQVTDIKCKAAIAKLDKMLYTSGISDDIAWDGKLFWDIIVKEFTRKRKKSSLPDDDGLPPLYPEK